MTLKYVNHKGVTLEFFTPTERLTAANFHAWKVTPNIVQRKIGEKVYSFDQTGTSYPVTLTLRGELEDRHAVHDAIVDLLDADISANQAGTLINGDWSIKAFGIAGDTHPNGASRSDMDIEFYCPYPKWEKQQNHSFPPMEGEETEDAFLNYPYDYKYDYSRGLAGTGRIIIDHYADSNFLLTIYGEAINPSINVNGHTYKVFTALEEGEYLQIDSRENTVTKFLSGGVRQNIYNLRDTTSDVFAPIPSGTNDLTWSGRFGFDISIYIERREPRWS